MPSSQPRDLYQRTFLFACAIVNTCKHLSRVPGVERQIAGQLLRSGTSIGANFEELKAAYTPREFACRYSIVLREARETHFWLKVIEATGLATPPVTASLTAEAGELVAIFTTSARKARAAARRGSTHQTGSRVSTNSQF
jgi:four helix bundle protein